MLLDTCTKEPESPWGQTVSVHKLDNCFFTFFFFLSFCLLELHLWHMEVLRLGVKAELQLPTYTTATAMPDLSCICNLYHGSQQHRILNPLSEARDPTCILMDTSRICFHCDTTGTPNKL